ncbi:MAG: SGNH/GDSL hydrolase family protein [Chloroflexi bacterium]|nr:SGNH/GDSL hydrolase family protein [Chloroflexota bacterium]
MAKATTHFLLWFLFLIGLIFLIEAYLRISFPLPWVFDPSYGYSNIPNMHFRYGGTDPIISPEYLNQIEINGKGLRGREFAYEKGDQVQRALVLGDSFTAALEVPLPDSYVQVLEDMLNKNTDGKRFEVINAGVSGYSTTNELLYWRFDGYKYHPDLVVLQVYYNDISENSYILRDRVANNWPYFILDGNQLVLNNFPGKESTGIGLGLWRLLPYRLLNIFNNDIRVWRRFSPFNPLVSWWKNDPHPSNMALTSPYTPEVKEAWQLTEGLILQLNQEVKATGSEFVVMVVPMQQQIESCSAQLHRQTWPQYQWDFDKLDKDLCPFLQEHRIACLSLLPYLRAYAAEHPEPLYYKQDLHLSPNGQRLVGQKLFEFLTGNGYLTHTQK